MKMKIGRYLIEVTHPEKVWFPDDGITKGEVVEYYRTIAPVMLAYLKDRPITMHRFLEGITGDDFYHKEAPEYFPSWIKRVTVKKEGGVVHHVVCNNAATLVYLANQATITVHTWLSRIDDLYYPDRMIFDLDPSDSDFSVVRTKALVLKGLLEDRGLVPFVMTTGSRGLHVVVPLRRKRSFDEVRAYAHEIAQEVVAQDPKQTTLEVRKQKRRGRLFIDTLRNAYAQTGVCAYSVRARAKAPVATPLYWDELADKKLTADRYTIKIMHKRLDRLGDPWKEMAKSARAW